MNTDPDKYDHVSETYYRYAERTCYLYVTLISLRPSCSVFFL